MSLAFVDFVFQACQINANPKIATISQCSYEIFTDGSQVYAQNCNTGAIDYSGTATASVINSAISALMNGGLLFLKAANNYPQLTSGITINNSKITLEGEGAASLLVVSSQSKSYNPIAVSGSQVTLQNFAVDASSQVGMHACCSGSYGTIYVTGSNETISEMILKGGDLGSIESRATAHNVNIENNILLDNGNNGIEVYGSRVLVEGNHVIGTSLFNPVSIISAKNSTVEGNDLVTFSQYSGSAGSVAGVEFECYGGGPSSNILVSSNLITGTGSGIKLNGQYGGVDCADDVTIVGNHIVGNTLGNSISHFDGISVLSGSGIAITSNTVTNATNNGIAIQRTGGEITIDSNNVLSPYQNGISLTATNNTRINDNSIVLIPSSTSYGIYLSSDKETQVNSNTIRYGATALYATGSTDLVADNNYFSQQFKQVRITGSNTFALDGNQLQAGSIGANGQGITVESSSKNGVISNNLINGQSKSMTYACIRLTTAIYNVTVTGNNLNNCANAVREDSSGSDYNLIAYNYIAPSVTVTTSISYIGNHTRIIDNFRYNPIGKITNFVFSGGTGSGDGNYLSPIGTSSTLIASTTYTITTAPCKVLILVVGSASISIDGGAAFTPTVGDMFELYPGETINFGAFASRPPTIQVTFS